jgi:hypothetical protein
MPSSFYDKAKHIVEVHKRILAVFIVDSKGDMSDLFIAHDANIDQSVVESVRSYLNLRFGTNKEQQLKANQLLGKHLWAISEYDKIRVIKIYEPNRLIVVLAKVILLQGMLLRQY